MLGDPSRARQRLWAGIILIGSELGLMSGSHAGELSLASGLDQTALVELYSSEGCSSCPPADEWLSSLRADRGLWSKFVPVGFHVDYWDRLGWADRFAQERFTSRQRAYAKTWGSTTVYTPGFAVNGREARVRPSGLDGGKKNVGALRASSADGGASFQARFEPVGGATGEYTLHAVLLGNGLKSQVAAGENAGRLLKHEFVALGWVQARMKKEGKSLVADINLPEAKGGGAQAASYSVAFWVTRAGDPAPIQAVGGDLPAKKPVLTGRSS